MVISAMLKQVRTAAGVARWVVAHPANRRRPQALPRAVIFQVRGRLGRKTMVSLGGHSKMWAVLHHTASAKVAYASPPDWAEMQAWAKILGPGDLFVDVGANAGSYSVWVSDLGAHVVAVEPGDEARQLLRENITLNLEADIDVVECALGSARGFMTFTQGLDSTNHLLPREVGGHRVEVTTLDEVLSGRHAAGVKIDVEGAERLVLEGAETSMREGRIDVLQLEWNGMSREVLGEDRQPVEQILRRHGYELFRPDQKGTLHPVSSIAFGEDIFAVRSDKG